MKQFGKFNVRVIFAGDRYGLNDCLTVEGAPQVEFYDATADKETFGERGQFTGGRYYVETLLLDWHSRREREFNMTPIDQGLCLCGHVRAWDVDGPTMARVRAWLIQQLIARATVKEEAA